MDMFKGARIRIYVIVVLVLALAGGLGVYFSRTAGSSVVKINIVTWPGYGPIYLGQAKGFFKEEGVQVNIAIQENTQARTAALMSGEIDLIGITSRARATEICAGTGNSSRSGARSCRG